MIALRVPRNTLHNVKLWVLISEGNGWDHVATKINAENEDSRKWERNLEYDKEDERSDFRNVGLESVGN